MSHSLEPIYYIYQYIRIEESKTAPVGTPYYIGKGKGLRYQHDPLERVQPLQDYSNVQFLGQNTTEDEAFDAEKRLIKWWGRKDNGTGILMNLTDGGEGASGYKQSPDHIEKRTGWLRGYTKPLSDKINKNPEKIRKTAEKHRGMTRTEETCKNISESTMGRVPWCAGLTTYYQPDTMELVYLRDDEVVPVGYLKGDPSRIGKGPTGKKWCHNPSAGTMKGFHPDSIPEGWVLGRLKKVKA